MQLVAIYGGLYYICYGDFTFTEQLLLAANIIVVSGTFGFTIGHELGHRENTIEKILTYLLYQSMNMTYFRLEHNVGHHTNVATPNDPATSRYNESFYKFLPRTIIGSFLSPFKLERQRLKNASTFNKIFKNEMYICVASQIATAAAVFFIFGAKGLAFFLVMGFLCMCMLEVVNYIEHYGLVRQKGPSGRYERVKPCHSWNTNHKISNIFLFRLQRHSDHHANPQRPYQILRTFEDVPQMPFGYPLMVVIAVFPPLWFKLMNPRVLEARQKFNLAS